MIPKAPGDNVKTDTHDCRRLARLHRAGELIAIRVPSPLDEAVRDSCRSRGDIVEKLTTAPNRLTTFSLGHSNFWRGGLNRTVTKSAGTTGVATSTPRRMVEPDLTPNQPTPANGVAAPSRGRAQSAFPWSSRCRETHDCCQGLPDERH